MFQFFPYSNFHRLNADWILKKVQELATAVEGIAANVESWAARIQQAETDAANAVATANNAHTLVGRAIRWDVQSLTDAQQAQARTNIGATAPADIPDVSDVVRYSPQDLTPTQQTRARLNIDATSQNDVTLLLATKHYVKYDEQNLTPAQQVQARANIGAAYSGDVTDLADRVTNVEDVTAIAITSAAQTLTNAQKAQARSNIGAGSAVDVQTNANEIQNIYGEINSLVNLLTITATLTGATSGTWAGATWDTIKNNIQHGRVFRVTIAGTDNKLYVMFTGIGAAPDNTEVATSVPILMNNSYQSVSVTSNGNFYIKSF